MLRRLLIVGALALTGAAPPPANDGDVYTPGRALVTDINRVVTANGVQESFVVTLGGARQWVSVRGADRANPILLFIHGGPGSTESHIAWSFQRPWEDYFTVVQWDQRGAGKSFPLNDPKAIAPTLTPDRYRDDAIALIELLRKKYGKRKIIVMGHSWGSIVGLSVAVKRPDLLYAYVGMGQAIDFRENERQGFEWTLRRAREEGNAEAVKELDAIRPFPTPTGPFDTVKMSIERKWNVYFGGLAWGRRDGDFYLHAGRLSPEHTLADRRAIDAGSDFSIATLWPKLADLTFKDVTRVDTPVIFLLGRHDYTCPPEIAAAWLKRVRAPAKKALWFEHSAHLPMIEEPGRVFAALLHDVRPLAKD